MLKPGLTCKAAKFGGLALSQLKLIEQNKSFKKLTQRMCMVHIEKMAKSIFKIDLTNKTYIFASW